MELDSTFTSDIHHSQNTVFWGNWGITFMRPQPDLAKNYGLIVGTVYFPVGTRGPCNTHLPKYRQMVKDWIENDVVPEGIILG